MTKIEWSREAIQAAWKAFNVASENPMRNALDAACAAQGIIKYFDTQREWQESMKPVRASLMAPEDFNKAIKGKYEDIDILKSGSCVEIERYKAIASKAIREQIDVRKDERERCAKIAETCKATEFPEGFKTGDDGYMRWKIAEAIRDQTNDD